ncbi:hypothetical protein RMATCC62417_07459 [Rhizopus microsporus]|nr:hypothetical protein RMATCC62417_07459 [Rhizopus microsporus]
MKISHNPSLWLPLSFKLANYLRENEIHKRFLTINESVYFECALESFATWIAFISYKQANEESVQHKIETTVFRVRSMLSEQLIPHLFYTNKVCCQLIPLDILLEEAQSVELPNKSEIAESWQSYLETHINSKQTPASPSVTDADPVTTMITTTDDNMPKKKEDSQEQDNSEEVPIKTEEEMEDINETSKLNQTTETDTKNVTEKMMPANDDIILEEITTVADSVPIIDVFHTLELDRAAMIEQRKLEEFEAQEELNEAEEEKENSTAKSLSMFNADGNFNLKYLLQGIVANRQKTSLSDRELQNLLSDFRPHRSKWASDERVGQEELYEACEKVLTDLKNYTEHSTPFLNKVSKREAPDYFEVIKKPMDLGTVTKKMKNLCYRSKKEFADDLFLIYDNCLMYNTNSASEYRKHAIAMRRKTERLLTRVPDITIKDRMDNEIEEEGDEISEEEESEPQKRPSKKSSGKHTVSSKTGPISSESIERRSRERSITRGSSAAPFPGDMSDAESVPENGVSQKSYGGKTVGNQAGDENIDLEQEDKKLGEEIEADMGELQDQIWREKTKKTRARFTSDVEKQYQYPFGEREALVRSGLDMERFSAIQHLHDESESIIKLIRCENEKLIKWIDRRPNNVTAYDHLDLDSSDDENLDAFFSRKIAKPDKSIDDSAKTDLFLPEYKITSGLPEIDGVPEDLVESRRDEGFFDEADLRQSVDSAKELSDLSFDIYPELAFPNYGLMPMIDRNIQTLEKIRLTYAKCNAIKNNTSISSLTSSMSIDSPSTNESVDTPLEGSSVYKMPPISLTSETGYRMCQRVISKLLTHAGFEGTKTAALNVLTDIMTDYITNIGRTLRNYWDDYGHKMSGDNMLLHTLYENGITDLSELEMYCQDEVERNIYRLEDIHTKLQTSYQDILANPDGGTPENEENILNDEETYITGLFGEDIGEDYFGFKDMGLDKEYNLDTLNVPASLWFGKNKEKLNVVKHTAKEQKIKYHPPPSFEPVTSEKPIIGLLQPYFSKRLADSTGSVIEDEFLPNRNKSKPRYPPTTKNVPGRKKMPKEATAGGAGGKGDIRKYKKKRPVEEINAEKAEKAEKKRLRMEERAQRIAEKEQRRKMKEELKEQEKLARMEAKEKKKALTKKSKQPATSSKSPMQADEEDDE